MNSAHRFSNWMSWSRREDHDSLEQPGVYAIAISDKQLSDTSFSICREIVYFGMTNGRGGLKGRLRQFENTIGGKKGHGGAQRVRFKHADYGRLTDRLFVSICPFNCDVTSAKPRDLRVMGDVARFEFECFARYVERFAELPEFNDKKRSLKKSKRAKAPKPMRMLVSVQDGVSRLRTKS